MTDALTPTESRDYRTTFNAITPLNFGDINALVCEGYVELRSLNLNGEDAEEILLDRAEALILRNWLNQVLA